MATPSPGVADAKAELEKCGVLLLSDKVLPSLSTFVAGEVVSGSWWAHPRAHDIARVGDALHHDPDVIATKLVAGKVTFVHRELWPALIAVGLSRESWQTAGLASAAKELLARLHAGGTLRTDDAPRTGPKATQKLGDVVRNLERQLLVHSSEVHTESGAHAKQLESWEHFARRVGTRRNMALRKAKQTLEKAVRCLCGQRDAPALLPWQ